VSLVWVFLLGLLFILAAGARLLMTARRWSREIKELQQHGVETAGTVVRKISYNTRGGRSRYIRYAYRDQFGTERSRKTMATADAWDRYQEGGPIEVIYSYRTPQVSAAKFVYDMMSKAVDEHEAKKRGPV
jgi:hypothetical protein